MRVSSHLNINISQAVFEGIGIVLNRQATAGAPAPAPLPPPELAQSPENALLNSNFAVANGSPPPSSSFSAETTDIMTSPDQTAFMSENSTFSSSESDSKKESSSWLRGWFSGNKNDA